MGILNIVNGRISPDDVNVDKNPRNWRDDHEKV